MKDPHSSTHQRIFQTVAKIPCGQVATYGQIARLAGLPNGARLVGYAMARAPNWVPWQRVVAHRRPGFAYISIRDSALAQDQRLFLEAEGVAFTENQQIDLGSFGYRSH